MKTLLYFGVFGLLFFSCNKHDLPRNNGNNYKGFIYTSTNSTDGNAIIALGRLPDGTVEELKESPYPTGSRMVTLQPGLLLGQMMNWRLLQRPSTLWQICLM